MVRASAFLLSVSLSLLAAPPALAFAPYPLPMLQRGRGRTGATPQLRMQDGGKKGPDESWRDRSDDYDGGDVSGGGPQPPPYSKPRAQDYEWLRGRGSLFEDTRGRDADPIRQQEWNAVNRFSSESGFVLAGVGIVLLLMVYTSIYNNGGMDGSRRYAPVSASYEQGCDLEEDPSCRY